MHIDVGSAFMAAKLVVGAIALAAGLVVDGHFNARRDNRSKRLDAWRRKRDGK